MPLYNKETFDLFWSTNRSTFPYNEVLVTRSAFYPRWLFFRSPYPQVIRTSTLDIFHVQQLIIDKRAYPIPPMLDEVIDVVDDWSKLHIEPDWAPTVFCMLAEYCEEEYGPQTQLGLFREVTCRLLEIKLNQLLPEPEDSDVIVDILIDWDDWYFYEYKNCSDFCTLTDCSLSYISNACFNYYNKKPAYFYIE